MSRSAPSLGLDEALQRFHAGEQPHEIVLAAEREHRIDEVVPNPGFALLNLQAVGEEVRSMLAARMSMSQLGATAVADLIVCPAPSSRK